MKFSIWDFSSKCEQIQNFLCNLFTFTKEFLNGKLLFFSDIEFISVFSPIMTNYRTTKTRQANIFNVAKVTFQTLC